MEAGPLYKPQSRDFELVLKDLVPADAERLRAIWSYWEESEDAEAAADTTEDLLHPDHLLPQ